MKENVRVSFFQDHEEKLWDDFVDRSPQGTFFHLIGWKKVIEKTFGYRSCYLAAYDDCGICGCLPLFQVKNIICGNALISVPFGVTGGICADNSVAVNSLLHRAQELAEELGADYIELRQASPCGVDLPEKDLYVTFERELESDADKNMAAIPRKQRRMIRQGMKHDLVSSVNGKESIPLFYEIYAHSVHNLGTPVFPYKYFQCLMEIFEEKVRIHTVWHQETPVAAVLTFFYKNRVMPHYSGALKSYFHFAVNDFMYWELMKYGCEHGFTIFDFGRSKRGTGSFDFKRHWGFEPLPLPYQYSLHKQKEIPNVSPTNSKFKPFIALWKKLPLPIANIVGPHLIRYVP
ncbi:FemAB family XrtA/PEP-CTERM system-associated protein [Candidatus Nitrospira neomarina]|uniref:FemAB family PEP-CTERM system-associated protein n=1 Tax=Candidatus Nitrospira neomarina TaxID=3020899 RepID=A0AA96JYB0_9BACT|nr:FemAB family XrtA/PEP-CTERM system-associated protein [Candidatus Nitrospira neomarina]WNM63990.1 FemAB family PEP-CTERM system-associated protein [Candidatus Nitrospira neomarina]